jgi:pimeloyl-ACP methyl ester carboxylesterase
MRDFSFESPFDMLPEEATTVRARWITTDPEPERVAVLHPAWNDEDYDTRTRIARMLLERGVASVLIQHPLYGERRRGAPLEFPVPLVSDFCVMGRAAVLEGRSLVTHLVDAGYRVGVSGYSMGGNIAGFVGALVEQPVAVAPLAASYAAEPVFFGGVLRNTIAWDSLGGKTDAVIERLGAVLRAGSILNHPPPEHTRAAVIVGGTRDGYVPTSAVQAIHRHWPGSRMEWVRAGHASLLIRHRPRLIDAIVDAFDRLETLRAETTPAVDG